MSTPASDKPLTRSRRAAREAAFQALYAIFIGHQPEDEVLEDLRANTRFHPDVWPYIETLVEQVHRRADELDQRFAPYLAKGWPLEQIAFVDRLILRMAVEELWSHIDIPPKVTIVEYVQLANKYGSKDSRRFVHGVLGSVVPHSPKANWIAPEVEPQDEDVQDATEQETDSDEGPTPAPTAPWVLRQPSEASEGA